MIRTQENGIYLGKSSTARVCLPRSFFAFGGKKTIRAHKKPKKHRVRPTSTAGKPVKTGRHCSDTARKPKKTAKNCPEPEKPAPKGGGAAMSSRSTGRQVYFKFVGSDTAHADRPRHGSDHGRRERPIPDKGGRTDSAWLPEEGRQSKCPEADTRDQNGCAGGWPGRAKIGGRAARLQTGRVLAARGPAHRPNQKISEQS